MDRTLFFLTIILVIAGLLIITSSSIVLSQKRFGTSFYYASHQLLYGALAGMILLFFTSYIPYKIWRRLSLPAIILAIFLTMLTFLPSLGVGAGGARRWLALGPIVFQPAELLKFSLIIYLASWLEAKREEVKSFSYGFVPFIVMIAIVSVLLIMQPDIGTLGIVLAASATIYFLGGGKVTQLLSLVFLGGLALILLVQAAPYRLHRFLVFLNPAIDPQGISYQINQAFIAIGSGGFGGLGFGQGIQKYSYLPEPMGDSVFAVFAEEFGFLGATILIALFLWFLWRGFLVARYAPDNFSRLLASGLSAAIVLQAFINISAISGLLPLTGVTLPFISYGSTSLVLTLASVGILLNISRYT